MTRKTTIFLLACLLALSACLLLVGCQCTHAYDSDCDEACNLCGYRRDPIGAHKYTTVCSDTCTKCGGIREVAHQYSSACAEVCTLCGANRTAPLAHDYPKVCSSACSQCGARRDTTDQHNILNSVRQNEVVGDCFHKGTCDVIGNCIVCGETVVKQTETDYHHSIPSACAEECAICKTPLTPTDKHKAGKTVKENVILGDCSKHESGSHNDVVRCTACNKVLLSTPVVDEPKHNIVIIPAKAATEREDGYTEGKYCNLCNEVFLQSAFVFAQISGSSVKILDDRLSQDGSTISGTFKGGSLRVADAFAFNASSTCVIAYDSQFRNVITATDIALNPGENVFYMRVSYSRTPEAQPQVSDYNIRIQAPQLFTVTYKTNMLDDVVQTYYDGEVIESPFDPLTKGYDFVDQEGWTSDGKAVTFPYTVKSDVTFTAQVKLATYTISYYYDGAPVDTSNPTSYTINDTVTLAAPNITVTGFNFTGWYVKGENSGYFTEIQPGQRTGNLQLHAAYALKVINVTYELNGGTSPFQYSTQVHYGSVLKLDEQVTRSGYVFGGWFTNKDFSGNRVTSIRVGENDFTLYVKWHQIFVVDEDAQSIVGLTTFGKTQTSIIIPSSIDGCPIKTIGSKAFADNTVLQSVYFESGVETICESAFSGCSALTSVTLPSTLTLIENMAFLGTSSLKSITLPASLQRIGGQVFSNSGLTAATFENAENWIALTSLSCWMTGEPAKDPSAMSIDVSVPATAATLLTTNYVDYYLYCFQTR